MKIRDWIEILISPAPAVRETAVYFLFEAGCTGIEESGETVQAYFPGNMDETVLRQTLEGIFVNLGISGFELNRIPHEDWGRQWREHFKAIRVTDRIVVKPPWARWNAAKNDVVVEIMPQMAFGTGTHESTQLALALMQEFLTDDRVRVLDIGTGSGILAISAARMKPVTVIAVEIDPEAIANTRENIRKNRVEERVRVVCGDLSVLRRCAFDLILANISRNVLLDMIPLFENYSSKNAVTVLSGILLSDLPDITAALQSCGYTLLREESKNEWVGVAIQGRTQRDRERT